MSNPKHPIDISVNGIRDFATALESHARLFRDIAETMEKHGISELKTVYFYPSGDEGLTKLMSFVNGLNTAFGIQLTRREPAFQAVHEAKANYQKASKTADKVHEKAETVLKAVRKKKSS
jgi:hypothetical protein